MIRTIATLMVACVSTVAIAQAPANPPVRIRGTIEKLDGQVLTIKGNDGQIKTVKLKDNFLVMGIERTSIDDLTAGKFIGTTTVGERNGALVALEVHIFPENMRIGKDRVLEVQYKGGAQKVVVPDSAVIVSYNPADRTVLKPGAPVFVISQPQPDGSLIAARVNVGLNGQAPPM